jgi:hypothetical protein
VFGNQQGPIGNADSVTGKSKAYIQELIDDALSKGATIINEKRRKTLFSNYIFLRFVSNK